MQNVEIVENQNKMSRQSYAYLSIHDITENIKKRVKSKHIIFFTFNSS